MPVAGKTIPFHKLKESTDQGFQIERVDSDHYFAHHSIVLDAHRDDHYIFLFQVTQSSEVMVDFSEYHLKENTLFFILPGQVHKYIRTGATPTGWFVALDTEFVPDGLRMALEDPLLQRSPICPGLREREELLQCLELIFAVRSRQTSSPYFKQAVFPLLASFVAMVTAIFTSRQPDPAENYSRSQAITQQFRKLVSRDYKSLKRPADYAAACNLSLSYLNEAVKSVTGVAVSYWIQQQVILEAKRLLYHSDCSIKEIAVELGYDDHAYFCRLFKKAVGQTPGDFRKNSRE